MNIEKTSQDETPKNAVMPLIDEIESIADASNTRSPGFGLSTAAESRIKIMEAADKVLEILDNSKDADLEELRNIGNCIRQVRTYIEPYQERWDVAGGTDRQADKWTSSVGTIGVLIQSLKKRMQDPRADLL